MKTYQLVGRLRHLDVEIEKDGQIVYAGMVDEAPYDIKQTPYNGIEIKAGKPIKLKI